MKLPVAFRSRRSALHAVVGPLLLTATGPWQQAALAFDNRLPKDELELKYPTPRTPGPKPTLGVQGSSKNGLKPCTDGKPHCFSSSAEVFDEVDNDLYDANAGPTEFWQVEPFKYQKTLAEAFSDVKAAVAAYPPGQRGIDGGGFKIITEDLKGDRAYVYIQYESRRKGYIDDMEFALAQGTCNVRTSSRLGYLDYGVNAKRYEWFASRLSGVSGWTTAPLRYKGHEGYFDANGITDKSLTL